MPVGDMGGGGVDLSTYRQRIGQFDMRIGMWVASAGGGSVSCRSDHAFISRRPPPLFLVVYLFLLLRAATLPSHGDVERNPGPASSRHDSQRRGETLRILYFNARSLFPKKQELSHLLTGPRAVSPHLIAVSETWLSGSVPDSAVAPSLPGYGNVFRADRSAASPSAPTRGGGVLLLVKDGIKCRRRDDLAVWPESVWLEVTMDAPEDHTKSFVLGCIYRAPSSLLSDVDRFAVSLESALDKVDERRSTVVLVGDFNATSPVWNSSDSYNAAGRSLESLFLRLGLHQCVDFPTHLRHDGSLGSLLDLVLVSDRNIVSQVSSLPPIGQSDHVVVQCSLRVRPTIAPPATRLCRIWKYDGVDFKKVNSLLQRLDWSPVLRSPSVDKAWHQWKSLFASVVNKHVPSKVIGHVRSRPPWMTSTIASLVREKHIAWRAYKRSRSDEHLLVFRQLRNKVTASLRAAERQHLQSLHRDNRLHHTPSSAQCFWGYVKRMTGKVKGSTILDLEVSKPDGSNVAVSHDDAKANALNNFFVEQTRLVSAPSSFPDLSQVYTDESVADSLHTSPSEVFDCLRHLKPGKAPGLDELPPKLLSACAPGIAGSLCDLFNRSFDESTVPSDWKMALVVPVYKGGSRSTPSNYRPIALLSIVSKVMEKIVFRRLHTFLSPVLSSKQSGFRKKDSTNLQLIRLIQEWSAALDSSRLVGVVFF